MLPGNWFFLDAVGGNNGGSSDTRGMAASVDGSRLFVVNRRPPSLQVWDTSLSATGFPRNKAIGATDICRQGSTVAISGSGDEERAYVTCFQDGQVYVVDPRGDVDVEDIILVGRGPYAAAAAKAANLLLVTNFLEDTIGVIDIAPASKTHNRVVLRIGTVRQ
jgi:DNA-binding beta-propeller fold protein YncE